MRRLSPALLVPWISAASATALAENGYFSGEQGARATGRAGAFTARSDDLAAVDLNPAGLARIRTTLVQVGNRFSYNAHSFQRAPTLDWGELEDGAPAYVEFAAVENAQPWQALDPLLGVASNLGLEDVGFALAVYAPAGIARQEFPVEGAQRYMMVSREAMILNYTASAAWKHADTFGVGATLKWIHVPRLEYAIVIDANTFPGVVHPVRAELDMLSTVTGSDAFTPNAILGAWYKPAPFLELGLSGQVVPAEVKTESTMAVEPLNPEIVDHVDLRREGRPANDVSVTLPLPLSARIGVRYLHLEGGREIFDLELDVAYESWSRVDTFTVDGDGLVANLLAQRVDVGLIDVDKRWNDTLSVHLGGDFVAIEDRVTLRSGLFYESALSPAGYAHVDFVSGPELGGAVGASVFLGKLELALAYGLRFQPERSTTEGQARVYQETPGSQCEAPYTDPDLCHGAYLGRPGPPVNAGTYRAHSHVMALDALYRF